MQFSSFQFVALSLIAVDSSDWIKKQKTCIKHVYLLTDYGLFDQKAFYKVKNCFYLLLVNDGKLINYYKSLMYFVDGGILWRQEMRTGMGTFANKSLYLL